MNRSFLSEQRTLALAVSCFMLAGCGGSSGPKTIPASGLVTYKGQPVERGTVTFSPADPKVTVATTASIVKGQYQTEKGLGLTAGDYKVVVMAYKTNLAASETKDKPPAATKPEDNLAVPQKYTSYKTTDLELKVTAKDASVKKDFDLKD